MVPIRAVVAILIALVLVGVSMVLIGGKVMKGADEATGITMEAKCMQRLGVDSWEDAMNRLSMECMGCNEDAYSKRDSIIAGCCRYYCKSAATA